MTHDEYLSVAHPGCPLPYRVDVLPTSYLVVPVREATLGEDSRERRQTANIIGVIVLYHQVRSAKRPEGTVEPRARVAVTMEEVPGKGWVAHAAEVRATAQGETESEALANLRELLSTYPETLAEVKAAAGTRHVELVTV